MTEKEKNQTVDNPYETPQTPSEVRQHVNDCPCPVCGKLMERGHLHSSSDVRWLSEESSKLANFVKGGFKLPFSKKALSLGRSYHGRFCRDCLLTIIDQ